MGKPEKEKAPTPFIDASLAAFWLPAIIESADDAIISKTLDGIITSWNKAAERIFHYTADEIIGKPVLLLIPAHLRNEETQILNKIRHGERVEHFETVRVTKDGALVPISLTVSPIRTADGKIIGASKIARDITDQKRAEEERQRLLLEAEEARHEAEAANRAKDDFLALLSHELRTPLHSMRGWLTMLKNGMVREEQKAQALDVIARGVDAQNALIEDLLDVSRIVSGKLEVSREKVSLVSIVGNAVEGLRPAVNSQGLILITELDPGADEMLGDSVRLQQIVNNLVNNAIKFTPAGGMLTVRLERDGDLARLTVSDTGKGISRDIQSRIFERFEQGSNTSRRIYGGLGLGLAISRHLAELHQGSLTVQSDGEGKGSVFTLLLPLVKSSFLTSRSSNSRSGDVQFGDLSKLLVGRKVLVVEDNVDSLEMLQVMLEHLGAVVTGVETSSDAIVELGRDKFDLIISDLGLPGIDGFDLIREVRSKLGIDADALPAIALSGYAGADDRDRSLSNGFQVHLEKPLDVSKLELSLAALIGPRRTE